MRNRLQQQAKPRQQELLRRGGGHKPACVCGGELELLQLRDRVKLLLGPRLRRLYDYMYIYTP